MANNQEKDTFEFNLEDIKMSDQHKKQSINSEEKRESSLKNEPKPIQNEKKSMKELDELAQKLREKLKLNELQSNQQQLQNIKGDDAEIQSYGKHVDFLYNDQESKANRKNHIEIQQQKLLQKMKYNLIKDQDKYVSFIERENQHMAIQKQRQDILLNPNLQNRKLDSYGQANALDLALSAGKDTPEIYKDYFLDNPSAVTDVNIGTKWESMMKQATKNSLESNRSHKRGGFVLDAFKRGKMGIDGYFVIFGIVGIALIPTAIYYHLKPYKDYLKKTTNITKENTPDIYNSQYELDEISHHTTFYNLHSDEINEHKKQRLAKEKEIEELENQVYGKRK